MDLSKLPQLEGWIRAGEEFDPRTFLQSTATVGEAAAMSTLFWPEFTEYRNGVFLRFLFERHGVDVWFDELKGDKSAVEGVVNHVHLWDVFPPKSEAEYTVLAELAPRIAAMWCAALKSAFPAREFVVSVADASEDYGPTISIRSA
ncbi:hypothetical protein [Rhizomonospora bruguierae]|uniref:hypothetical protein n=1 Tax=Rhizomonospora bruguierae TaxID=1581705 RepID=UPI001BD0A750|nr:hypothetical protein [Micromonospora sp. NBRC 107566]